MKYLFISLLLSFNILHTMKANAQDGAINFLALGDSYTIGEAVAESERWPVQLAARLTEKGIRIKSPKIIATTGWRTDELKAAIEADKELMDAYDLVSLLIGVNNQYQGNTVANFAPEFEGLLQKAISLAGGNTSKVFVVSIPDYGKTPFGAEKEAQIEKELKAYNKACKDTAKKYGVTFFDITPISRVAKKDLELVANDQLHPSGKMYTQWVDLMFRRVHKMIKK